MSQRKSSQARAPRKRTATHNGTSANSTETTLQKLPTQPAPDDREGWKAYWEECQQPWRTEPEIDTQRQAELAKHRAIVPDIEKGTYPFSGMKLSRADIEWLLATHENGRGPVDWSDESQHDRKGLDLRGADLCSSGIRRTNLAGLPLTCLIGGFLAPKRQIITEEQKELAMVRLTGVNLREAKLEGAYLMWAGLEGADLYRASLEGARLVEAKLKGAKLSWANLEGAILLKAELEGADLLYAKLGGAYLESAQLRRANLNAANLQKAHLKEAQLEEADLRWTDLKKATLEKATLGKANLRGANLENARLQDTRLVDSQGVGPYLVDVRWSEVNLALADWSQIKILADEYLARQKNDSWGVKRIFKRLDDYREAVRANRQLAVVLQGQGLNEEASQFAYRANLLQRKVFWFQMMQSNISLWRRIRKFGAWGFSHLLNLLAGYGYRPGRSFLAYLIIVFGFMGLYLITSHFVTPHLSWDEALVLSLSSFHGRGFFTQTLTLGDPYARLAVAEAVMGLFVEVSLIATFTQRFFGK